MIWSALDKESKLIGANIDCLKAQTYKDTLYKNNKRHSLIYQDGEIIKEGEDIIIRTVTMLFVKNEKYYSNFNLWNSCNSIFSFFSYIIYINYKIKKGLRGEQHD